MMLKRNRASLFICMICAIGMGVLPVISLRILQTVLDTVEGKSGITEYAIIYILFKMNSGRGKR